MTRTSGPDADAGPGPWPATRGLGSGRPQMMIGPSQCIAGRPDRLSHGHGATPAVRVNACWCQSRELHRRFNVTGNFIQVAAAAAAASWLSDVLF